MPSDSALEIEAMVDNQDIGFVHPGQDAEIKVDTFDFTRFGLLHGKVGSVSQDAIMRDGDDRSTRGTSRRASNNGGGDAPPASSRPSRPAYRSTERKCRSTTSA